MIELISRKIAPSWSAIQKLTITLPLSAILVTIGNLVYHLPLQLHSSYPSQIVAQQLYWYLHRIFRQYHTQKKQDEGNFAQDDPHSIIKVREQGLIGKWERDLASLHQNIADFLRQEIRVQPFGHPLVPQVMPAASTVER